MTENTEKIQTEQVTPVPATPVTQTEVKTESVAVPVANPTEEANKKQTAAFIKMRQELRDSKRKLAEVATATPPPVVQETAQPQTNTNERTAPAPIKAEVDIEAESVKAIEQMSMDADVRAVPGAIMDLIDMVDNDPRLSRLHNIDPVLAFQQAKSIWASKVGISAAPIVPKPTTVSGGIPQGHKDLNALMTEIDKHRPGTREYSRLAREIDAEIKKQATAR